MIGQTFRQKRLSPRVEMGIGVAPQGNLDAGIHRHISGRDPRRFIPPSVMSLRGAECRLQRPTQCPVECIPYAGGAVVTIVVVAIVLVLFLGIPRQEIVQGATLHRCQSHHLLADRAIFALVRGVELVGAIADHPVLRVAGEKAGEKIRLVEVEHPQLNATSSPVVRSCTARAM